MTYLKSMRFLATGAGLLAITMFTIGCSQDGRLPVYPVKGTVYFDGQPMEGGGSISFIPKVKERGKAAGGVISPDGTYVMSTYQQDDGSITGEFTVIISQTVYSEPMNDGSSDDAGSALESVELVPVAGRIPDLYADPRQSPLTITVEAKSLNEVDFQLERK